MNKIEQFCHDYAITPVGLANHLGVNKRTVHRWLAGKRPPFYRVELIFGALERKMGRKVNKYDQIIKELKQSTAPNRTVIIAQRYNVSVRYVCWCARKARLRKKVTYVNLA